MVGASVEMGKAIWDPLEVAQWRDLDEMRACELANGRVAMLASVGWVWPQVFGLWKSDGLPVTTTDPIDAITQVPTAAWVQILFFCGALEGARLNWNNAVQGKEVAIPITGWGGKEPNPSRPFYDPLDFYPKDQAGQDRMQLRELKHARMAMLGFAGMFVHHFMPSAVPGLSSFH